MLKAKLLSQAKKKLQPKRLMNLLQIVNIFLYLLKKKKYFSDSKQINQKFTIEQEDLIKLSEGNIYDFYDFKNRLGEGHFYLFFIKNFINFQVDMALFFFAFIIKQT